MHAFCCGSFDQESSQVVTDSTRWSRLGAARWLPLASLLVGLLGAIALMVFGSSIGALPRPGATPWWFNVHGEGWFLAHLGFYVAIGLMILGWAGLGLVARVGKLSIARCWAALVLWGTPLFLGPPLFSRDIYSYIAQGLLAHEGLNPSRVAPNVLAPGSVLSSVAKVWLDTPSPYGPLIARLGGFASALGGHGMMTQVWAFRTLELLGVVLLMLVVPIVARTQQVDRGMALWLAVLSPLALFSFISSAHNEAVMLGLMMSGIALALTGKFKWGIALCALAATVKLPAIASVVFLAVDRIENASRDQRAKIAAQVVGITLAVIVGMTLISGFGFTWLGPEAFHIPTKIRVLTTPTVSLGTFIYGVLHGIGLPVPQSPTVTVVQDLCWAAALGVCLWLLINLRRFGVLVALGLALLIFTLGNPTLWPWYWTWGVVVLAATAWQRSKILAFLSATAMLLVGAGGTPMLTGGSYWVVVPVAAVVVATVIWWDRRRRKEVVGVG